MAMPIKREDPWFWLRDDKRQDQEILNHLRSENAYTEQETAHLQKFREELYAEHLSHLQETDDGPAHRHGPWFYYTRTVEGLSYKIHCRKAATDGPIQACRLDPDSVEQVLLDENQVAEGKSQCVVVGVKPSPGHDMLAYSVDFTGNETYTAVFLDLSTGGQLPDRLEGVCGAIQWGGSNAVVFYTTEDAAKRPWKLWKHVFGEPQSSDVCLYTEEDELFYLSLDKTTSGRFLLADSGSTETSEVRVLDLEAGEADKLQLLQKREFGLRYEVAHSGNSFLILTNKDEAINNKLMSVHVNAVLSGSGGKVAWKEVMPYNPSMRIEGVTVLRDFVALEGREGGLTRLWVMGSSLEPSSLRRLEFQEELYEVEIGVNKELDTPFLRLSYSSLTTPRTQYDCDLRILGQDEGLTEVWQQRVPNFDPSKYTCRRFFAKAPDGTQIPVSMVHLKSLGTEDGAQWQPRPCLLYGYGSYGICVDPGFNVHILPYLDRGLVYCIANIRGGGEMGRHWYEKEGKYLTKRNTFSDFVACAECLVEQGITTPNKLAIEGRSAGGLLIGSVLNMRPDLFRVAVAGVPFVDIMNTMCDPSIPLTTGEWEEWGNPNEWKYFDYMLSYSPYDNVHKLPYPDVLITAGLYDPRVAYWEPAKWASKLRVHNTKPDSKILLKMDLEVGHFSASDRYRYRREKAFEQAVVLDKLGLAPMPKL